MSLEPRRRDAPRHHIRRRRARRASSRTARFDQPDPLARGAAGITGECAVAGPESTASGNRAGLPPARTPRPRRAASGVGRAPNRARPVRRPVAGRGRTAGGAQVRQPGGLERGDGEHGPLRAFLEPARLFARRAADFAFPPHALDGGAAPQSTGLSADAWSKVVFLEAPWCEACGAPFEHAMGEGALCAACDGRPRAVSRIRRLRYESTRATWCWPQHADRTGSAMFALWLARGRRELLADAEVVEHVPRPPRPAFDRATNKPPRWPALARGAASLPRGRLVRTGRDAAGGPPPAADGGSGPSPSRTPTGGRGGPENQWSTVFVPTGATGGSRRARGLMGRRPRSRCRGGGRVRSAKPRYINLSALGTPVPVTIYTSPSEPTAPER